ncbi:MAG: hypothetical protein QOG68_2399 [Solirubrobacteraceae bacterium]|nr:hypothetical protein [Solirubrobacteraceae bacterium]
MRSVLSVCAAALAFAAAPDAGAATLSTSTSTNWAGYAVMRSGVRFSRVSAAWTVPAVDCSSATTSWSAIWVGLGGYADSSPALEQVGTEADCDRTGHATYAAWYELVPDVSRDAGIHVSPGDVIHASVTVHGRQVQLRLADVTTGKVFKRLLTARVVDLTSAEWIVEAPSSCSGAGCRIMPLADFGRTRISEARTRTANGHVGAISDPAYDTVRIQMSSSAGPGPGFGGAAPVATTGALAGGGRAFSVRYDTA